MGVDGTNMPLFDQTVFTSEEVFHHDHSECIEQQFCVPW
jgi:hypothetical protein